LWYPGAFGIGRVLGPGYSLRCVLFHDISDSESVFTQGLNGTVTRKNFQRALEFLSRYYTPVSLQDVVASFEGQALPRRAILVTFDDGYASTRQVAAPLCLEFRIPAVVFANASCLDNRELALDNLVCYVANTTGLKTIQAAIRDAGNGQDLEVHSLPEVFGSFLPNISLSTRMLFRNRLVELAGVRESELAAEAGLYLSSRQVRDLADFNFEIGNHTYNHVHCRSLLASEFAAEIDRNGSVLEAISGGKVRSFSVPYGSSSDLTSGVLAHLQQSGYEAAFLAEGRANFPDTGQSRLNRVSVKAASDAALFSEIEVLPRLRSAKDRLPLHSKSAHISGVSTDLNL